MRLPSGTRMCLLVVFAFLLITTEFPEFSRFKPANRGKLPGNSLIIGEDLVDGEDGELVDLTEANADIATRSSIMVEAWGYR